MKDIHVARNAKYIQHTVAERVVIDLGGAVHGQCEAGS